MRGQSWYVQHHDAKIQSGNIQQVDNKVMWYDSSLRGSTLVGGRIHAEERKNEQIRACQSPLPVASTFPVGLRSIDITTEMTSDKGYKNGRNKGSPEFLCPCNIHCTTAVLASQNWTPRSFDPETTHCPSCDTATERT